MIKKIVKNLLAKQGLELRRDESIRGNPLRSFMIPRDEWEYKNGGYLLRILDIVVTENTSPLLIAYKYARALAYYGKGRFFYDEQNRLQLDIENILFYVDFTDELYVLNDVFILGEYNFDTSNNIVVVDIGLNIGATSLFFAKRANVMKVYAYELFPKTYQAALRNFSLNDSSKIISYNVGLGKENIEMKIGYSNSNKATMGFKGLQANMRYNDAEEATVLVRDVAEEFQKIEGLEQGRRKVCKIDCEGAEFEIMNRLFEKDLVRVMDVYMIEWHGQDTNEIVKQFLHSGFEVINSTSKNWGTGIIYAYKIK